MTEDGSLNAAAAEDEVSRQLARLAAEGYAFTRHVPLGEAMPWSIVEFRRV